MLETVLIYTLLFSPLLVLAAIVLFAIYEKKKRRKQRELEDFLYHKKEISLDEFNKLKKTPLKHRMMKSVILIRNQNNGKCYIGLGRNVRHRIVEQFSGRGNGYLYDDYQAGNKFSLQVLPIDGSYNSPEHYILKLSEKYDSVYNGYNALMVAE